MNAIVLILGILFLGLILMGVYNVVVRKKKVENMYTPFDDATKGIKNSDRVNRQKNLETFYCIKRITVKEIYFTAY